MKADQNKTDTEYLRREIIILQRKIEQLKFQNSKAFRVLNIINTSIFIIYVQFILSYLADFNITPVYNSQIQFKSNAIQNQQIRLYTIQFKYKNYYLKSSINKDFDNHILSSNIIISKDFIFQIPQKLKFLFPRSKWYFVSESLGIVTICCILIFVQSIAFIYKQHHYYYPLFSISLLNIVSFVGILFFSLHIHNFI